MLASRSPRWCFSTEEYNERQNYQLITTDEKLFPDWFHLPYCDVPKDYRECTNNVYSCQSTQNSHYHVPFVKMNMLPIIVVIKIHPLVNESVM